MFVTSRGLGCVDVDSAAQQRQINADNNDKKAWVLIVLNSPEWMASPAHTSIVMYRG